MDYFRNVRLLVFFFFVVVYDSHNILKIIAPKYPAANARKIKQAVLNLSDSKKSIILSVINFRAFVWQGQPLAPAYWVIPKLILLSKICSALLILVLVDVAGFLPDFAMRDSRYTTTSIFKELNSSCLPSALQYL
jgi:hypothetical protein